MSDFERIYQTDPSREKLHGFEKHTSIEMSDKEYIDAHLARMGLRYVPPVEEEMTPALKEKFEVAKRITEETKVIDLRSEPSKVSMNLEMTELEKAIKKGKKDERKKNQTIEKRNKKTNSRPDKPAVARV